MDTRRRRGALPPKLTPERQEVVVTYHSIAVKVAAYHAKRQPRGLTEDDLFSEAQEALTQAAASADLSNKGLENYLWECVHGAVRDLIRKTAIDRGRGSTEPPDPTIERVVGQAHKRFAELVRVLEDPGDVWADTREDAITRLEEVVADGATVLSVGSAGALWSMRGEAGFVVRAEWVRTMRVLHTLVSELPPVLRAVMELRFLQEREIEDVATRTMLSGPTVTRRISEAIALLRARLVARGVKELPERE